MSFTLREIVSVFQDKPILTRLIQALTDIGLLATNLPPEKYNLLSLSYNELVKELNTPLLVSLSKQNKLHFITKLAAIYSSSPYTQETEEYYKTLPIDMQNLLQQKEYAPVWVTLSKNEIPPLKGKTLFFSSSTIAVTTVQSIYLDLEKDKIIVSMDLIQDIPWDILQQFDNFVFVGGTGEDIQYIYSTLSQNSTTIKKMILLPGTSYTYIPLPSKFLQGNEEILTDQEKPNLCGVTYSEIYGSNFVIDDLPVNRKERRNEQEYCWILMNPYQEFTDIPIIKAINSYDNSLFTKLVLSSPSLTTLQLKKELSKRNLSLIGTRQVLINRLLENM